MVVHEKVGQDVCDIFRELFDCRFPIEKIAFPEAYGGNDSLIMEDNATSAYNDRYPDKSGGPFSYHMVGLAIDINPRVNPFWKSDQTIEPDSGYLYMDRTQDFVGKIDKASECYRIFRAHGWRWGGDFKQSKDWQHFDRPDLWER